MKVAVPKKEELIGSYIELKKMFLAKNKKQKMGELLNLFNANHIQIYKQRKALSLMKINCCKKKKKRQMEKIVLIYFKLKLAKVFANLRKIISDHIKSIPIAENTKISNQLQLYQSISSCILIQRFYRRWKFGKWLRQNNTNPSFDGNKIKIIEKKGGCSVI